MRSLRRSESAETLIEVLITIAIVGIGVVGILPALANATSTTQRYRQQSRVDQAASAVVEAIQNAPYSPCTAPAVATNLYDSVTSGVASAYGVNIVTTEIKLWALVPATTNYDFSSTTCTATTLPLFRTQAIRLRITTSDGRGSRKLQVVKRP